MNAREKFDKHLKFWSTRPFPKRKGKRIAQMMIEAMDRKWKEMDSAQQREKEQPCID
jgi:hypothetical protein